tara:strand:+ start:12837 stop:13058 length:222 start_codon:yes stop_codon:yes gene_type:complete
MVTLIYTVRTISPKIGFCSHNFKRKDKGIGKIPKSDFYLTRLWKQMPFFSVPRPYSCLGQRKGQKTGFALRKL